MPLIRAKEPKIPFNPPHHVIRKTKLPYVGEPDGKIDKPFWDQAEDIGFLHDIEGDHMPAPLKKTVIKMLWDENNLYVGAKLYDDEIWAYVKNRDEIVYMDNDFEIFLAPMETSHRYYEIETNAAGTVWDLLMEKPFRDGVHRIVSWDVAGLKYGCHVEGELNNASADNKYWSVEFIIPFFSLRECGIDICRPTHITPDVGEMWRCNFSRVEYKVDVIDNKFYKRKDEDGNFLPEFNWVWAPTGIIDIHMPEMWGYIVFGDDETEFKAPEDEKEIMELRKLYYRLRTFGAEKGYYTTNVSDLVAEGEISIDAKIYATPNMFEIIMPDKLTGGTVHLRHDGFMWRQKYENEVYEP